MKFETQAERTLKTMEEKARALNVEGVAVVAYLEDAATLNWIGRMQVVGKTHVIIPDGKGYNLIAVAWSKASELMITLRDSGNVDRQLLHGELGFRGGAIRPIGRGYLVAAFSGGSSDQDYEISCAGLNEFQV